MRLMIFELFKKALSFGAARFNHSIMRPDPRNLRAVGLRVVLRALEYMVVIFSRAKIFSMYNNPGEYGVTISR